MRTRGGGTSRTQLTQELVSERERKLQEVWGQSLNKEEVERSLLGTVMDDLLQKAMEETIPEIVMEARSEVEASEHAVQQRAAVILREVIAATASTPAETAASEPREGTLAPSHPLREGTAVAEDTPRATDPVQVETTTGEESLTEIQPSEAATNPEEGQAPENVVVLEVDPEPGPSGEGVEHQVQVHQERGEEENTDSDGSSWSDRLIQGDVAPKLPVLVQRTLRQKGVFLVIATNVVDNVWTTQLVDGTLTLKEQADIRSKGGEVLITRDPDAYRVASMNLDVEWLQHQIKMRDERQEGLPLRVFEEVPEVWKGRRKKTVGGKNRRSRGPLQNKEQERHQT